MNFAEKDSQSGFWECVNCHWVGSASELETDRVETCFGPDEFDVCPVCGGYDLAFSKEGL